MQEKGLEKLVWELSQKGKTLTEISKEIGLSYNKVRNLKIKAKKLYGKDKGAVSPLKIVENLINRFSNEENVDGELIRNLKVIKFELEMGKEVKLFLKNNFKGRMFAYGILTNDLKGADKWLELD